MKLDQPDDIAYPVLLPDGKARANKLFVVISSDIPEGVEECTEYPHTDND